MYDQEDDDDYMQYLQSPFPS